jgi:hypothetical protein
MALVKSLGWVGESGVPKERTWDANLKRNVNESFRTKFWKINKVTQAGGLIGSGV